MEDRWRKLAFHVVIAVAIVVLMAIPTGSAPAPRCWHPESTPEAIDTNPAAGNQAAMPTNAMFSAEHPSS